MKPTSNEGKILDSNFSIEKAPNEYFLIVESRGGKKDDPKTRRNPDYLTAMDLLLERMKAMGVVLLGLQIASQNAMRIGATEHQRELEIAEHKFPLHMETVADIRQLRLKIGHTAAAFGRKPGSTGGNPTKRITLHFKWPGANGRPAEEVAKFLADPSNFLASPAASDEG